MCLIFHLESSGVAGACFPSGLLSVRVSACRMVNSGAEPCQVLEVKLVLMNGIPYDPSTRERSRGHRINCHMVTGLRPAWATQWDYLEISWGSIQSYRVSGPATVENHKKHTKLKSHWMGFPSCCSKTTVSGSYRSLDFHHQLYCFYFSYLKLGGLVHFMCLLCSWLVTWEIITLKPCFMEQK